MSSVVSGVLWAKIPVLKITVIRDEPKKSAVDASSGSEAFIRNVTTQVSISRSSNGNSSIPPQTKSGCI